MKRSNAAVLRRLQGVAVADVCMSVVTKSELLYGVEVSPRHAQDAAALAAFLPYVEVLDFPDDAAPHYAEIRAALKKRGSPIGANDLFIAAHERFVRVERRQSGGSCRPINSIGWRKRLGVEPDADSDSKGLTAFPDSADPRVSVLCLGEPPNCPQRKTRLTGVRTENASSRSRGAGSERGDSACERPGHLVEGSLLGR